MEVLFVEANMVTLELSNKECYYAKEGYDVYLNGKYYASKLSNVFSIYDLEANKEYVVKVGSEEVSFKTLNKKIIHYIKKPELDDTASINLAIKNLGSDEVLELNDLYHVTSLVIEDNNKAIYLGPKCIIMGDTNREHYKIFEPTDTLNGIVLGTWEGRADRAFYSCITILGAKNVRIFGPGMFDCNAQNSDWWINHREMRIARRPKGVFVHTSEDVVIEGITIKNTPSWNCHPFYSKKLSFLNLKLINPWDSPTTDGCDPEACEDVKIIGNYISVGDDCIAIKSSKIELAKLYHRPSTNIVIRNNFMAHGHAGVTLGSENSGGINNVHVSQCYFNGTDRGLRVKSQRGRGKDAIIDNINFSNIIMDGVKSPFVINAYYKAGNDIVDSRYDKFRHEVDDTTPSFEDFTFKNIKCQNVCFGVGCFLGLPESKIRKVLLENVEITYNKESSEGVMAMTPDNEKFKGVGFVVRNVKELELKNVIFKDSPETMFVKDEFVKIINN